MTQSVYISTSSVTQLIRNVQPLAHEIAGLPLDLAEVILNEAFPGIFDTEENKISATNSQNEKRRELAVQINALAIRILGSQTTAQIYSDSDSVVSSRGGTFLSLTKPVIYIPSEFLDEKSNIKFKNEEKEFLISKELLRISYNVSLYCILFLAFMFSLALFTPSIAICAMITSAIELSIYIPSKFFIENFLERKSIDRIAQKILAENPSENPSEKDKISAKAQAYQIASDAIEKTRQLNLYKKETTGSFLICPKWMGPLGGTNVLKLLDKPPLLYRAQSLSRTSKRLFTQAKSLSANEQLV